MAAGSISLEEFDKLACKFVRLSEKTNDTWERKEIPDNHYYLYKKEVKMSITEQARQQVEHFKTADNEDDCQLNQTCKECLTYEYHIVYSSSYNVPVLYFNVYHQSGCLLSLDELWSNIPDIYKDRLLQERWSFLTQQEHPILGRPYFMLHPCHTKDLMAQVSTIQDKHDGNYILGWLSAVGPVVGLQISKICGM